MRQRLAFPPLGYHRSGGVYLVLDCQADRQTLVADLRSSRYRHPLRVVAFDAADGWMCDVTAEVARQILSCAAELEPQVAPCGARFLTAGVPEERP
jgi:hypothetical protein